MGLTRVRPRPVNRQGENLMNLYGCKSCGKVNVGKENLCEPEPVDKVYECERCGDHFSRPDGIEKTKPVEINYFCGTCGRGAVSEDELCNPAIPI